MTTDDLKKPPPTFGPSPSCWHKLTWDKLIGWVADIPWGVILLIFLVGSVVFGYLQEDDLKVFATAAGLLGVGHGIHTGAKNLAPSTRTNDPRRP